MSKTNFKIGDHVTALSVKGGVHVISGQIVEIKNRLNNSSNKWVAIKLDNDNNINCVETAIEMIPAHYILD